MNIFITFEYRCQMMYLSIIVTRYYIYIRNKQIFGDGIKQRVIYIYKLLHFMVGTVMAVLL